MGLFLWTRDGDEPLFVVGGDVVVAVVVVVVVDNEADDWVVAVVCWPFDVIVAVAVGDDCMFLLLLLESI